MHSSTAIKILVNRDWHIHLAINPNTPPETLDRLAGDLDWFVRCNVAQNPSTPLETLVRLAGDLDWFVRCNVAQNPNTPEYIKEYITAVEFMRICYGS